MLITTTKELAHQECCNCGCDWWISQEMNSNLRKTKRSFYCPNGHAQSYTKSTAEFLQGELDQKNNRILLLAKNSAKIARKLKIAENKLKKKIR